MRIIGTSLAILCTILGTIQANILDDIMLNNWRDKGPVSKQSDSFYNPFGLPFSLFGDLSAEEPRFVDMTIPEGKPSDVKVTDLKVVDTKTAKGEGKEMSKKSVDRSHNGEPWFSFSDFMSMPEMPRKRNHDIHKGDVDKITQTGDLAQTKTPVEGDGKKSKSHDDEKDGGLIFTEDHKGVDDRDRMIKNGSKAKSFVKGFGSSFPKGLSDILIIFQKVGPKLMKSHSMGSSDAHACNGVTCYNGMCQLKKSGPQQTQPAPQILVEQPKKESSVLEHFDRLFLLIIPIVLGIGTVFFALELRRIYRKMKKQALITTTFEQC